MKASDLSDLTLPELLDELAAIPDPPAISWWPETEAWGWAALAAAVLGLVIARRILARRRASAYRRAALRELARVRQSPPAVATLLRRTALAAYPRREVAGLSGDAWLRFLDETSDSQDFSTDVGRTLAAAPYSPHLGIPANELAELARRWIVEHRRERRP